MRRSSPGAQPLPASGERHDWQTIKKLLPYLWAWKWRVMFALGCLISAKFANVTVPLIFKQIVDGLDISRDQAVIVVPAALLASYGALRFSTSMFTELREIVFARVTQQAVRGDRHLYANRTRFITESDLAGFEQQTWPPPPVRAPAVPPPTAVIDLRNRMRAAWRLQPTSTRHNATCTRSSAWPASRPGAPQKPPGLAGDRCAGSADRA